MRVLSFQHKNVIRDINANGVYIAKVDSEYRRRSPRCYDMVFKDIPDKEIGSTQPIFGWHHVMIDGGEITVNEKTIKRCLLMTPMDLSTHLLFEMDIPKEKLSLQDFYAFVDAKCVEEGLDKYYKPFNEFPAHLMFKLDRGETEVQCTFSSIRKEYIKNIYEVIEHTSISQKNHIIIFKKDIHKLFDEYKY